MSRAKRFKRMATLSQAAESWLRDLPQPQRQTEIGPGLAIRLLGPLAGAQVAQTRVEAGLLRLKVPDPSWRVELSKHRPLLLEKARALLPKVRKVVIEP